MKKIIAFILSIVLLCSLAACTARQDGQTAKNIKGYSQVYAAIKKQYDDSGLPSSAALYTSRSLLRR